MNTEMLDARKPEHVDRAAELLQQGKLVAVPTETVYGLAANASDPSAVNKIFSAKGRPNNHPLIVHIASVHDIPKWAINVPPQALQLAATFWPGPLTLLFEKGTWVANEVTGGHNTIALRVPAHPVMQKLLQITGFGLAAPSANPYQRISTTTAKHVYDGLAGKVDAILDGGSCVIGLESTIVDMTQIPSRILRSGPITVNEIMASLGDVIEQPVQHNTAVSGNKKVHYQPYTPLYVMPTRLIKEALSTTTKKVAVVFHSSVLAHEIPIIMANEIQQFNSEKGRITVRQLPQEKRGYSKLLYKTLHELDTVDAQEIWLERPPQTDMWLDVNDRLSRACTRKMD